MYLIFWVRFPFMEVNYKYFDALVRKNMTLACTQHECLEFYIESRIKKYLRNTYYNIWSAYPAISGKKRNVKKKTIRL